MESPLGSAAATGTATAAATTDFGGVEWGPSGDMDVLGLMTVVAATAVNIPPPGWVLSGLWGWAVGVVG